MTVPAGPAPGGYCAVVPGTFTIGTRVVVRQAASGTTVTAISCAPAGRLVSSDLAARTGTVTIGSGVTEVTYTNRS